MGMTTLRQVPTEQPTATTYWRRRFVALVISLTVLSSVAWATSKALGGGAPKANPAATRTVHRSLPLPSITPVVKVSKPAVRTVPQQGHTPRPHVTPRQVGLLPCQASAVVLSLFSSQASYSIRQSPEFEVNVVSVGGPPCTFDIGSRHVWVQIRTGNRTVWTSRDCAEGQASLVTVLHRGIPTVISIVWDGQASSSACPGPATRAIRGSYSAVAYDGAVASQALDFRIS
jgi:hypothetical protein